MNQFVLLSCLLVCGAVFAASSPVDNAEVEEWCQSYEMKCVFIAGTHNGTTIHNKGAILDDCQCNFEKGNLKCRNELLNPEARNCKCKCH